MDIVEDKGKETMDFRVSDCQERNSIHRRGMEQTMTNSPEF